WRRAAAASARGSSAASWSCRRRSGRAAQTPWRVPPPAKRRTAPGFRRNRYRTRPLRESCKSTEVGAFDPFILLQLMRRAAGDNLTPMDHRNAVGQREQEFHVVLDGDDG